MHSTQNTSRWCMNILEEHENGEALLGCLAAFKAGSVCHWWSGDRAVSISVRRECVWMCRSDCHKFLSVIMDNIRNQDHDKILLSISQRLRTLLLWKSEHDQHYISLRHKNIVLFNDIQIWISGISLIFAIYLPICEIVFGPVCANHSIKVFSMNSWGILVNV